MVISTLILTRSTKLRIICTRIYAFPQLKLPIFRKIIVLSVKRVSQEENIIACKTMMRLVRKLIDERPQYYFCNDIEHINHLPTSAKL